MPLAGGGWGRDGAAVRLADSAVATTDSGAAVAITGRQMCLFSNKPRVVTREGSHLSPLKPTLGFTSGAGRITTGEKQKIFNWSQIFSPFSTSSHP